MTGEGGRLADLTFSELKRVAEIESLVFPEPLDLPSLEKLFQDPAVRYLAIREEGRLAAYFGFQVCGPTAHVIRNARRALAGALDSGGVDGDIPARSRGRSKEKFGRDQPRPEEAEVERNFQPREWGDANAASRLPKLK